MYFCESRGKIKGGRRKTKFIRHKEPNDDKLKKNLETKISFRIVPPISLNKVSLK